MTPNNGTLDNYTCSRALLLPLISEFTWPVEVRAFLYLLGLLYCFTGVAIIADIFMGAIEKITSTTRKVIISFTVWFFYYEFIHDEHLIHFIIWYVYRNIAGVLVERWIARTWSHWSAYLERHGSKFDINGSRLISTWNLVVYYRYLYYRLDIKLMKLNEIFMYSMRCVFNYEQRLSVTILSRALWVLAPLLVQLPSI